MADVIPIIYPSETYLSDLEHEVRQKHDRSLEFHNADHPCNETFPVVRRLAAYCLDQGLDLDVVATESAALGHDMGFHKPLKPPFLTKEERSAHYLGLSMQKLGADTQTTNTAKASVIATHRDASYSKPEDALVGIADMINTCLDYDWMLHQTFMLRKETQRLLGKTIDTGFWLSGSVDIISDYHAKRLPSDIADLPLFQVLMEDQSTNLQRLKFETPKSFLDKARLYVRARAVFESRFAPTVGWLDQLIASLPGQPRIR
jgi:hypothetical protein